MTPQVRMSPDVRTALSKLKELPVNTPIDVDGRLMEVRIVNHERTLTVNAANAAHPSFEYTGNSVRPHDGRAFGNVKMAHSIAKFMTQS